VSETSASKGAGEELPIRRATARRYFEDDDD
jgi:hypothetical protein